MLYNKRKKIHICFIKIKYYDTKYLITKTLFLYLHYVHIFLLLQQNTNTKLAHVNTRLKEFL